MPLTERSEAALEADDTAVSLGGSPVLRGVSLTIRPGEAVALLGGNGSGKSTLVRACLGLVPISGGTVRLFGASPRKFRHWERIGYVPQRSTDGLSNAKVKEVVASGRLARRTPFVPMSKVDRVAVASALEAVGLTERAGMELSHLSGGQQQRAMIARALAGSPDLLVLDEPTAGVDLEHQEILASLLTRRLAAGMAVLVVLHDAGPLAPLIDRAVTLRDGRVVEPGSAPLAEPGHHPSRADPPGLLGSAGLDRTGDR